MKNSKKKNSLKTIIKAKERTKRLPDIVNLGQGISTADIKKNSDTY